MRSVEQKYSYAVLIVAALLILTVLLCAAACNKQPNDDIKDATVEIGPADTTASDTHNPIGTEQPTALPDQTQTEEPGGTAEPTPPATPDVKPGTASILNEAVAFPSGDGTVTAIVCVPDTADGPCPFVVLCHGYGGSKNSGGGFHYIAEALYEHGIASIRIDFAGCGDNKTPSTEYCLSEMSRDIVSTVEFMEKTYNVDPTRCGLLGYSLGGRAVLETLAAAETDPYAIMLIAPAASTEDFIRLCGGDNNWNKKKTEAKEKGQTVIANVTLGYNFFVEFEENESPTEAAAANFHGRAFVVYASDDAAVLPKVSRSVIKHFGCDWLMLTGCGHLYGMKGGEDDPYITEIIREALCLFGESCSEPEQPNEHTKG